MRDFFENNKITIIVVCVIASLIGLGITIAYFTDSLRTDAGSDFVNFTIAAGTQDDEKIWEVRTKNDWDGTYTYYLYINIIDPKKNKRIRTITENPTNVYNSNISLYYLSGKVWLIQTGTDCPIINIYDATTFEKLMDIDKFENSHPELQFGIEELLIEENFRLHFSSANKKFIFDMEKEKFISESDYNNRNIEYGHDSLIFEYEQYRNNFVRYSSSNTECIKLTNQLNKTPPATFSQLLYHDASQIIIFLKNPDNTYSIVNNNNGGDKHQNWEIKQEEFKDYIVDGDNLYLSYFLPGNGKIVVGFNGGTDYDIPCGVICISIEKGEILYDWKVFLELE